MAFAPFLHSRGRPPSSPSSGHATVQETSSAETKYSLSFDGFKTWLTKKKDEFTAGSLAPGGRSQRSSGRDDQPMEVLKCVNDQKEKNVTTFQNDANSDTLAQALSKFDDLQECYSSSMKKISLLERQLKEARKQNQSLIEQLGGVQCAHGHLSKDQQTEQQISENLVFEKEEQIKCLKGKCEARDQQIKSLGTKNAHLTEKARYFEIDCYVEVEENQVLKSEIENLKRQLEALSSKECIEDASSDERTISNYKRVLTLLRKQVGDLNDDLEKTRDHSKEQSRQILRLRQQTEMTGMMESQLDSEERMRHEVEEESNKLRGDLKKANVTVTALQTTKKNLEAELKALKDEMGRFINIQNELNDLRKHHATLVDEHKQLCKSMQSMGTLSAQLAESEKTVRELEHQVQAANAQLKMYQSDFDMERRDREVAQSKIAKLEETIHQLKAHQGDFEGVQKQLVEHQQSLSAVEIVNEKLTKEVQLARQKCQGLEQDIQAKSSQVKQYAKEVERLKQQSTLGSNPRKGHSSPVQINTGFTKVNDLYKDAQDDIERLSSENSDLYDQIEELKQANARLREERFCNNDCKQRLTIQNGISNGVPGPQVLSSPTSTKENHVTLPSAQQAGSATESQQIIISAPLPVIPHTNGTASASQSLPNQCGKIVTPETLVDNYSAALQQAKDAVTPLPPSEAEIAPTPLHSESLTESDENELEHVVSESSHQPFPGHVPVSQSNDSQQDIHYEASDIEDSMAQYENPLQKEVDDEIHQQAAQVIQEVSGGRRNANTDPRRPFDPNLVCPMCRKKFRIGEIQKFKKHVSTCTGTDD